jgi:hypothetical protein
MTGWAIFSICIASGLLLGAKGFALPALGVPGWWMYRDSTGAFVNHSGSGDNLAAVSLASTAQWLMIGLGGVTIGFGLRTLAVRLRRP